MKLIKQVEIQKFRSIRDASLDDLGDFSVLAGLNNSGKSNFLRALNVFFNGKIDGDIPLEIERDYYRLQPKSKKKKAIRITVTFDLPPLFKFRRGLEPVEKLLGRSFSITKEWTRDSLIPNIYLNNDAKQLKDDDLDKATAFLNLVTFRYIPNRVIPTEMIQREQSALRDMLIRRLARFKQQSKEVFNQIRDAAKSLIDDLNSEIQNVTPDISRVRLATASSLADLAFKFVYRLQEGEAEMQENEQGSGIQSLLMFQTLHLIDHDYFQKFGWRQAAIWAVEEPESSLHTALEARIALFLSTVSKTAKGRLQIVASTHSDLMIQYADKGYYVDKQKIPTLTKARSTLAKAEGTRDLLEYSARSGVSRWVSPILLYPLDAFVLVEGKFDRDFIIECLKVVGPNYSYKIACLEDLTMLSEKGGVETLKKFIRENCDAIRSRRINAPVVVVLDWEVSAKSQEFTKLFKAADPFKVLAWDESSANPNLGKSFKGVERFYSDRIIREAETVNSSLIAQKKNGQKSVQPDDFPKLKQILNKIVKAGLKSDDVVYAKPFITKLYDTASVR